MKTNKDLYEQNKENLYSTTKDGGPKGLPQNIIAKLYPLVLVCLSAIILKWSISVTGINWKKLGWVVLIGSVFGLSWTCAMTFFDPDFPGWIYHPWAIVGIDFGVVFEDLLFYPLCGIFFFIVKSKIPEIGVSKLSHKIAVFTVLLGLSIVSLFIWHFGGISITLWFMIPGLVMMIFSLKKLSVPKFLLTGLFIVFFACSWDILAVTILPNIFTWANQWIYVSFDINGVAHHSTLWLDYTTNRWDWIGNSPLEITPWFSVSGWVFIYFLSEMINPIETNITVGK